MDPNTGAKARYTVTGDKQWEFFLDSGDVNMTRINEMADAKCPTSGGGAWLIEKPPKKVAAEPAKPKKVDPKPKAVKKVYKMPVRVYYDPYKDAKNDIEDTFALIVGVTMGIYCCFMCCVAKAICGKEKKEDVGEEDEEEEVEEKEEEEEEAQEDKTADDQTLPSP